LPIFMFSVVTRDFESAVASGTNFLPVKVSAPNLK
jgi:hypothetical protein